MTVNLMESMKAETLVPQMANMLGYLMESMKAVA